MASENLQAEFKKRGPWITRFVVDGQAYGGKFDALNDALNILAEADPREAHVVELRFFGGLSVEESAEVLKISPKTVIREWKHAKVWLLHELKQKEQG